MKRIIHAFTFATLVSCSYFTNAFELIKSDNYFSTESVDALHQGLENKLWLTQHLAFQVAQINEQGVESLAVFRPPFLQGNVSARIPQVAETKDALWFTYQDELHAVPIDLTNMPWEQRSTVRLADLERESVYLSDLINHFVVVPDENLLFVASQQQVPEANQQIAVYRYVDDSIQIVDSYDSGCPDIVSLHVSSSGFIVRCFNPNETRYFETVDGSVSASTVLENDQVIFLDRAGNYYLYNDPDTATIYKQNISGDGLAQSVSAAGSSLEYFNARGDFIVSEFNPALVNQLSALYRNDGNGSFSRFEFDAIGPNRGFAFSFDELFATNENTLLLNVASFSLEQGKAVFETSDWRDTIGISLSSSRVSFANNSLVSLNSERAQILEYQPENGLQAIASAQILIDDGTFPLTIDRAEADADTWWLTAFSRRFDQQYTTINMLHRDGTSTTVDLPSPETGFEETSSVAESLLAYDENTDSLIAWRGFSTNYLVCSDAKNLNEGNCEYGVIDANVKLTEYVKEGVVVASQAANDDAITLSYYQLAANSLVSQWQFTVARLDQVLYVPGSDYVYVAYGDANELTHFATIDLTGSSAGNPVSVNNLVNFDILTCQWSDVVSATCFDAGGVTLLRIDPVSRNIYQIYNSNNDTLEFAPLMLAPDNVMVTLGFDEKRINAYRIPDFDLEFVDVPTNIEAVQDIPLVIDASTFMLGSSLSSGSLTAELLLDLQPQPSNLTSNGSFSWQVLLPNGLTKTEPSGKVEFTLNAHSGWNTRFDVPFPVINVNDAPQAVPGANTGAPLLVGDAYLLVLAELIVDIDDDPLVFTTTTLPNGFVRDGDDIIATPLQTGAFRFSVTATDPGGLAVTVEVSGTIVDSAGPQQPNVGNDSGGSTGAGILVLLILAMWRVSARNNDKTSAVKSL